MKVQLYKNIHKTKAIGKTTYSVKYKGQIIMHLNNAFLTNCILYVSENGRQRVLRNKQKNVHAWIKGDMHMVDDLPKFISQNSKHFKNPMHHLTYNPYKYNSFVNYVTGKPVKKALYIVILPEGIYYETQDTKHNILTTG